MPDFPALDFSAFDEAVRPADDLFRHVNGRWLATADIPADRSLTGSFMKLRDEAEEAVRDIITGLEPGATGSEAQQIAELYASFMDERRADELGAAPLAEPLAAVAGIEDVDSLGRALGWLLRQGFTSLIGVDTDADPGNPKRYIAFVGQSGLGLPDEAYYREPQHEQVRAAYLGHIERMFDLAGLADGAGAARRIVDLETAIAACHWDNVRCRDMQQMYNPMSAADVAASAPGLPWAQFVEGAELPEAKLAELVNAQPSFFSDVAALITDDRIPAWRDWAAWRVVSRLASFLGAELVNERFDFVDKTLLGVPEQEARWKRGVKLVQGALGEAVGKIYVERHFSDVAKRRMDELVANVLEAYRRSITDLDWMTPATKQEALDKLSKFRPKIGFPAKWRDYSALVIAPDDLVGNVLRVMRHDTDYEVDRILEPVDPDEWLMTPQTVNAYYHPLRNEIVFPAAILQPPFFNEAADDAVNYGGIGSVIGHEIGHGFDDQGSTCDGDGYLRDWWTVEDRAAFTKRTEALIAQYDALSPAEVPDQHVNGALTIGENIGDLGGLGIALKAYALAHPDGEDPIDDLTPTQRLLLAYAAIWQTKIRPEAAKQRLAIDPHSPGEFRCNQIVRNVDAFYDAFGVTETDALWLDPADRVSIW